VLNFLPKLFITIYDLFLDLLLSLKKKKSIHIFLFFWLSKRSILKGRNIPTRSSLQTNTKDGGQNIHIFLFISILNICFFSSFFLILRISSFIYIGTQSSLRLTCSLMWSQVEYVIGCSKSNYWVKVGPQSPLYTIGLRN
jgi:hypothetical protein